MEDLILAGWPKRTTRNLGFLGDDDFDFVEGTDDAATSLSSILSTATLLGAVTSTFILCT